MAGVGERLSEFGISRSRGFLPDADPVVRLPDSFLDWEETAHYLPKLLVSDHVRATLDSLPPFPVEDLTTEGELRRAMLLLSYLAHAYVYGEGTPVSVLPGLIAVPWHSVATKLGRPPVLSYASHALDNWRRINPRRGLEIGNIHLIQNFTAGIDEEWFFIIHIDIERLAAPALAALIPMQQAALEGEGAAVVAYLAQIRPALVAMRETLARMPEHCDPYIYFHRIRPFLHGWKGNPLLADGLVYEGVAEYGGRPQQFRGGSGAQSSIIPAIDAALGIVHESDMLGAYLREMREYMPPPHRAFLAFLESGPGVRGFVASAGDAGLRAEFDACVAELDSFRSFHLEIAALYVFKQGQTEGKNPTDVGTGGTPFMKFLKQHRDTTRRHALGD